MSQQQGVQPQYSPPEGARHRPLWRASTRARLCPPDSGEPNPDASLAAYTNVGFPVMPLGGTPGVHRANSREMEKNCSACHVNNVWETNMSRAACGTCHDNVASLERSFQTAT